MTSSTVLSDALLMPDVTPAEAETLAQTELRRLLALLESLDAEDWLKPTACTEWNVRDMTAHQAGAYASGTGYRELIHQYIGCAEARPVSRRRHQQAPVGRPGGEIAGRADRRDQTGR